VVLRVTHSESEQRGAVEVQDSGPGLSEEDQAKLYGKFARLSAQPTAGESSTGLGLSIAKRLAQLMQGDLVCRSRAGEGATFSLLLPTVAQKTESPAMELDLEPAPDFLKASFHEELAPITPALRPS
jgi:signal transduction histidine kinase